MRMIPCRKLLPDLPVRTLHLGKDLAGRVPEGAYYLIELFSPK